LWVQSLAAHASNFSTPDYKKINKALLSYQVKNAWGRAEWDHYLPQIRNMLGSGYGPYLEKYIILNQPI